MTSKFFFSFLIFFTYSTIIFEAVYKKSEFLKKNFCQITVQCGHNQYYLMFYIVSDVCEIQKYIDENVLKLVILLQVQ